MASLLDEVIEDKRLLSLLLGVIESFHVELGKGIPLGNLTSQLFANIYMHPFDLFVKQKLKVGHYIRYADDFVFLSDNRDELEKLLPLIQAFFLNQLALEIHPKKISLKTIASGVDFLGWVHFPHRRVLRTKTKKRMMKRIIENPAEPTLQSYLGMLGHGDGYGLGEKLRNIFWICG